MLAVVTSSCFKDNAEELIKTDSCNSKTSTFKATVLPILNENKCNVCHSTATTATKGNGIILDNHTEVLKYVTNEKLLESLKQEDTKKFTKTPPGAAKLDNYSIEKIDVWIKNNAKND